MFRPSYDGPFYLSYKMNLTPSITISSMSLHDPVGLVLNRVDDIWVGHDMSIHLLPLEIKPGSLGHVWVSDVDITRVVDYGEIRADVWSRIDCWIDLPSVSVSVFRACSRPTDAVVWQITSPVLDFITYSWSSCETMCLALLDCEVPPQQSVGAIVDVTSRKTTDFLVESHS